MKLREFNRIIKSISDKKTGLIDKEKIKEIPEDIKENLCKFIIKYRQPLVKNLIPRNFDWEWLSSMGYMYEYNNGKFDFICTSEHYVKFMSRI